MKTTLRRLLVWSVLCVLSLTGSSCAFQLAAPPEGDAPPFDKAGAMSLAAQARSLGDVFGLAPR